MESQVLKWHNYYFQYFWETSDGIVYPVAGSVLYKASFRAEMVHKDDYTCFYSESVETATAEEEIQYNTSNGV